MLILVPICLFMTGIAVVITVHSYRSSKKELSSFKHSDFSTVFATKICDKYAANCDTEHLKSHCSFEKLVSKETFI